MPSISQSEPRAQTRPRYINPYKKFVGSVTPEWLEVRTEISAGAKLCYARLARYHGQNASVFRRQPKLAAAIGVKSRQIRNHLSELQEYGLIEIRRVYRRVPGQRGVLQNEYRFLEHPWMFKRQSIAASNRDDRHNRAAADRHSSTASLKEENQKKRIRGKENHAHPAPTFEKQIRKKPGEKGWLLDD